MLHFVFLFYSNLLVVYYSGDGEEEGVDGLAQLHHLTALKLQDHSYDISSMLQVESQEEGAFFKSKNAFTGNGNKLKGTFSNFKGVNSNRKVLSLADLNRVQKAYHTE